VRPTQALQPRLTVFLGIVSATATSTVAPAKTSSHSLLSDYVALMKPRVSVMVIVTAAAGFYLGSLASGIPPFHLGLMEALFGISLVTAGSSVLNQALERTTDLLMPRTASRPMAQRRIGLAHGLILGFALIFGGSIYLALEVNPITGILTLIHLSARSQGRSLRCWDGPRLGG